MRLQDTLLTEGNDTLFVPLYIYKDSTFSQADSGQTPAFQAYVSRILNDSFPQLNPEPTLLQEKTYIYNKQISMQPLAKKENQDWEFLAIFVLLALLALFLKFFRYGTFEIIRSCFSFKDFEVMTKSSNALLLPTSLLYFPIVAIFGCCAIDYFQIPIEIGISLDEIRTFLLLILVLSAFIWGKMLLVRFFGSLFRYKNVVRYYVINQMCYLFLTSLLLLLPVTLCLFAPDYLRYYFIIISAALIVLLSLIRVVRGLFLVFNTSKFSRIYLFCYLCTIEFLPLLLIAKAIISK